MGHRKPFSRPGAAFAALALSVFGLAHATPARAPEGDIEKLNELHAKSSDHFIQRVSQRCNASYDSSLQGSNFSNARLPQVLAMDKLAEVRPELATQAKALLLMADSMGMAICYDTRHTRNEFASALYMKDRVITLNPSSLTPDQPILGQQTALAITLQYFRDFAFKSMSDTQARQPIGITIHPGSLKSAYLAHDRVTGALAPAPVLRPQLSNDRNELKPLWRRQVSYQPV